MRAKWGLLTWIIVFSSANSARAEIEPDPDHDLVSPLKLPSFKNPFQNDSDDSIRRKVQVHESKTRRLHLAREESAERARGLKGEDGQMELHLPANRCEVGKLTWGSRAGIGEQASPPGRTSR